MNHSDVRGHMADYLEGDLVLDKRALFDAHLDECVECAQEIEEVRGTIALLRSLPEPEVPDEFPRKVMQKIRAQEAETVSWSEAVGRVAEFLMAPRILAPASISLIVAGLILGTGQVEDLILLDSASENFVLEAQSADSALAGLPVADQRSGSRGEQNAPGSASIPLFVIRDGTTPDQPGQVRPLLSLTRPPTAEKILPRKLANGARAGGMAWRAPVARIFRPYKTPEGTRGVSTPGSLVSLNSSGGRAEAGLGWGASGRQPSADEWLGRLLDDPAAFATGLSNTSLAEQELWIEHLARRALERGDLAELVRRLRSSPSPRARLLAEDFAASGRDAIFADGSGSAGNGD